MILPRPDVFEIPNLISHSSICQTSSDNISFFFIYMSQMDIEHFFFLKLWGGKAKLPGFDASSDMQ